jgi:hypothetical protein
MEGYSKEVGYKGVYEIHLAEDGYQWQVLMNSNEPLAP